MFGIELYGMGVYGTAKGPERVSFGGDNIDDAISPSGTSNSRKYLSLWQS
jgi:hypothetical protein